MSPTSSTTGVPASSRTYACSSAVAICVTSFEVHDESDRVPAVRVRDADLVDHVLDEQEPPASRLLEPFQLRLEIGNLCLTGGAAERVVGDRDRQHASTCLDVDLDRELLATLVPVLDGVHRRLRDGGLQLLHAR